MNKRKRAQGKGRVYQRTRQRWAPRRRALPQCSLIKCTDILARTHSLCGPTPPYISCYTTGCMDFSILVNTLPSREIKSYHSNWLVNPLRAGSLGSKFCICPQQRQTVSCVTAPSASTSLVHRVPFGITQSGACWSHGGGLSHRVLCVFSHSILTWIIKWKTWMGVKAILDW